MQLHKFLKSEKLWLNHYNVYVDPWLLEGDKPLKSFENYKAIITFT